MAYDTVSADEFEREVTSIRREFDKQLDIIREDMERKARAANCEVVRFPTELPKEMLLLRHKVEELTRTTEAQNRAIKLLFRSLEELIESTTP